MHAKNLHTSGIVINIKFIPFRGYTQLRMTDNVTKCIAYGI